MKTSLSGLFDEIVNRPDRMKIKSHHHDSDDHCEGCEYERIQRE